MGEERITTLLLDQNHFWLMIGIFGVLYTLKKIKPVGDFLFSDNWRWIIPILNIALSFVGIFLLSMTSATTPGMKVIIAIVISAITSYGYELTKPLFRKIMKKIFGTAPEVNGNTGDPGT